MFLLVLAGPRPSCLCYCWCFLRHLFLHSWDIRAGSTLICRHTYVGRYFYVAFRAPAEMFLLLFVLLLALTLQRRGTAYSVTWSTIKTAWSAKSRSLSTTRSSTPSATDTSDMSRFWPACRARSRCVRRLLVVSFAFISFFNLVFALTMVRSRGAFRPQSLSSPSDVGNMCIQYLVLRNIWPDKIYQV